MLSLVISATENIVVDLFSGENQVNADNVVLDGTSEDILKAVKVRLGEIPFEKVDNIFVNVGPGSFTGIRASLALVFGLSMSGKQKIIPFTSFDMFEYNEVSGNRLHVVAGFSNFVYVKYMDGKKVHMECITFDELSVLQNQNNFEVIADKDFAAKLAAKGIFANVSEKSTSNVIALYQSKKLEKRPVEPVYLRASQAEIQRQERENGGKAKRKN